MLTAEPPLFICASRLVPGRRTILSLTSAFALTTMLCAPAKANEKPIHHRTNFTVSLGLITLATVQFDYDIADNKYTITGSGKSSGLIETFTSGYGRFSSSGIIIDDRVSPRTHEANVREKKKNGILKMSFDAKGVTSVYQNPDKRTKRMNPDKYFVVKPADMMGVVDPASAIILPAGEGKTDGNSICNRRIPVYDGETRYDMVLSYKGTKSVSTKGYSGNAFVCNMRYVPISGHRKKPQRSVEYMANNKNIDLWFAPLEGSRYYSIIRIEVGTWIGNFVAAPDSFGPT